jgi:hypothetical protein
MSSLLFIVFILSLSMVSAFNAKTRYMILLLYFDIILISYLTYTWLTWLIWYKYDIILKSYCCTDIYTWLILDLLDYNDIINTNADNYNRFGANIAKSNTRVYEDFRLERTKVSNMFIFVAFFITQYCYLGCLCWWCIFRKAIKRIYCYLFYWC